MTKVLKRRCGFAFLGFVSFLPGVHAAETPAIALDPYPESTKIATTVDDGVLNYPFIYGPVDKIKRDVFFEKSVRLKGTVHKTTYEMSAGTDRAEVMDWFLAQFLAAGAQSRYQCEGADCGRATIWASEIFKQRQLSAPTRQQAYAALSYPKQSSRLLIALYVAERGNRRVVAHIERIQPDSPVDFATDDDIAEILTRDGVVLLAGITPETNGTLSNATLERLQQIASSLAFIPSQRIYAVCHLHESTATGDLLAASQICADSVANAIGESTEVEVEPVGIGPLAPADGKPLTRVELVIPHLIRRD